MPCIYRPVSGVILSPFLPSPVYCSFFFCRIITLDNPFSEGPFFAGLCCQFLPLIALNIAYSVVICQCAGLPRRSERSYETINLCCVNWTHI